MAADDSTAATMTAEAAYAAVIEAFADGTLVGAPPDERIDTHAAHIFLARKRAYKIKRPVSFSFLDFRTLEAREDALRAELRLNRRTLPDLYLDVLPITQEAEGLALAGSGPTVEWVLVMRRFPKTARLDLIADHGPLDGELAVRLGRTVAQFHATADIRADMGGAQAMADVVAGNLVDLRAAPSGLFEAENVVAIDDAARVALDALRPSLDQRRVQGFVRHCHGDLHLANIVALAGRVVPFDCIEFGDEIACIDTMYDLAFLLMDLIDRDQRAAAWRVLDAYLAERRDLEGLALMPFFMAVRATIRAKVVAFGAEGARGAASQAARRYLDLAYRLLPAPRPRLIAIGGLSGTGKSTLARQLAPLLAPTPGAVLLRSDVERKRLAGVPLTQRLRADAYGLAKSAACLQALRDAAGDALDAGWSVIVDAVHDRPEERAAIAQLAKAANVRFDGLWLEADAATMIERVTRRRGDASDADAAVVRAQLATDVGSVRWRRVAAGGDPSATLAAAAAILHLSSLAR